MFSHSYYSLSTGYEWLPDFKERRCFALANGTGQQCYLNCAIQLLLMLPLFNDPDPLIDRRKENLMILSQLQLMSKSTTSTTLTAEELNKRIAEIQTSIVFADLLIAVHLGKEQGDKKLKYILSADPYSADTDNCVRSFWAAVHEGLGTERLIGFDHTQQQDPSHFLQVLLQSPSLGGLGCSRKIDQHDQYDHLSPVLHYCRTTTTTPKYHKTCCVETVQTDCGTLITLDLPPLDVDTSGISFSIALALQRDQEPFDRASDGEVFECRQCEQRFVVGMCHRCEHSGCDMQSYYKFEGQSRATVCCRHQKQGMVDMASSPQTSNKMEEKCSGDRRCKKRPFFNHHGTSKPEYCLEHKQPAMVDVCGLRCGHDECNAPPQSYRSYDLDEKTQNVLVQLRVWEFEGAVRSKRRWHPTNFLRCKENTQIVLGGERFELEALVAHVGNSVEAGHYVFYRRFAAAADKNLGRKEDTSHFARVDDGQVMFPCSDVNQAYTKMETPFLLCFKRMASLQQSQGW